MDNLEYIDSYFNGQLLPEEVKQFEQKIESDPMFAQDVAFFVSTAGIMKEQAAIRLKDRFRELSIVDRKPSLLNSIKKGWYYSAAAAVTAAIIFLLVFYQRQGPVQLAEEYLQQHVSRLDVTMGISEDSLQSGINAYNEHHYNEAARVFEKMLQSQPSDNELLLYAGITNLHLGNYNNALNCFQRLEQLTLRSNPGKFYHAISLMKRNQQGDKENAKGLLQQVVAKKLFGEKVAEKWLAEW